MAFVALFTFNFATVAEQVYESTDEKGIQEFSDKPSPDAQVLDIEKPNVADSVPSETIKSSTPAPAASKTEPASAPEQLETLHQGTVDDEHRRKMHNKRKSK